MSTTSAAGVLLRLAAVPSIPLLGAPTPLEELNGLCTALGGGARLLVKRDDAVPFGFGGNKVRKLELVAAAALETGADTLVTLGGVQSNHARATAATAAKLGLHCLIIANGQPQERSTGNALLNELLGAEVEYIASRAERAAALAAAVERLRAEGHEPFAIPLGASTPLGALGFVRAVGELLEQGPAPDVIVHASSSGGTQAGLVAGCVLHGAGTRVIGVSADDPAGEIGTKVRGLVSGIRTLLGTEDLLGVENSRPGVPATSEPVRPSPPTTTSFVEVDDRFVGAGYGKPTNASREAQHLAARTEALFVDHTYTAKALAALIAYVRAGRFRDKTVVFWHTGGQVGIFA